MPSPIPTKERLRRQASARRMAISDTLYAQWSDRLRERLLSVPAVMSARTLHLFWPLLERREPDLRPLVPTLQSRGTRTVLPVVTSAATRTLEHRTYDGSEPLTTNRWGIGEPLNGAIVSPVDLDVILVPGLAFTATGSRLGYGGGFYDTFLTTTQATRIGVCYECMIEPVLPVDPHDQSMDLVVTEAQVYLPSGAIR